MQDFRKLEVWQRSRRFVTEVYAVCARLPDRERFGMAMQLRRAAVSICSNIAEGSGRPTQRDFARFLDMAVGSASEIESLLIVASDLGYVGVDFRREVQNECAAIRSMLRALRSRVLAKAE